jgi:hypothetical protein
MGVRHNGERAAGSLPVGGRVGEIEASWRLLLTFPPGLASNGSEPWPFPTLKRMKNYGID